MRAASSRCEGCGRRTLVAVKRSRRAPGPTFEACRVDDVEHETPLGDRAGDFAAALGEVKARSKGDGFGFPSDLMLNLRRLDELMEQAACVLDSLVRELPIADIGGGDGERAFFFESLGHHVHLIDHAPTNHNKLEGARALKNELGSSVEIIDLDIEQGLQLPAPRYGLTLFLGLLYQLKSPYRVLEELSQRSRYCFLSTRVARFAPDGTRIGRTAGRLPARRGRDQQRPPQLLDLLARGPADSVAADELGLVAQGIQR